MNTKERRKALELLDGRRTRRKEELSLRESQVTPPEPCRLPGCDSRDRLACVMYGHRLGYSRHWPPKRRQRVEHRRPEKYTEADEDDLRCLAWNRYSDVSSDLGRCHYDDFVVDTFFGLLGDVETLPTGEVDVARDAERLGDWAEGRRIRGVHDIAEDVFHALTRHDDPHHAWAIHTVRVKMRHSADEKGYL